MNSASILGHQMDSEFGFYDTGHSDVSPELQADFVTILGADGTLDISEQDGAVFFNSVDRELRFEKVTRITSIDDVDKEARRLRKVFSGREGKIIFDNDPDFYVWVRIKKIDVTCEEQGRIVATFYVHQQPYRYMVRETVVSKVINSSGVVNLYNSMKPVAPYVTVDSEMTLSYTIRSVSYTATVNAGTHIVDTLVLYEGITSISVTGSGTISFRYRQGML